MAPLAILLLLAAPELAVRASPPVALVQLGIGCAPVLLTAEIRGPEVESWYCPAVEWAWPDGTTSREESDCPPFAERAASGWHREGDKVVQDLAYGFPRRWTRAACMPARPDGEPWEIEVRLSRAGRVFARRVVRAHAR